MTLPPGSSRKDVISTGKDTGLGHLPSHERAAVAACRAQQGDGRGLAQRRTSCARPVSSAQAAARAPVVCPPRAGRQLTASADTASAASRTAWPGTIFRSPRLVCDPLPVPKLVAPAVKVNALPVVSA